MTASRLLLLAATIALLAACSLVPNQDYGTSGCANAHGDGPQQGDVTDPTIIGRTPAEAAAVAVAAGHTVVFNVPLDSFGECWCVPPLNGTVVRGWWGEHGQLFLQVEGVEANHSANAQPPRGWGC